MNLNKLSLIELHDLLYKIIEKLEVEPYVYDKENNITHYDYFTSNITAHYDAREELSNNITKD